MAPTTSWHNRWREARIAAGFTSADKLSVALRERGLTTHRMTAQAWETGQQKPVPETRAVLATISPLFGPLLDEIPDRPPSRADLLSRLDILEARLVSLEAEHAASQEGVSATLADHRRSLNALTKTVDRLRRASPGTTGTSGLGAE